MIAETKKEVKKEAKEQKEQEKKPHVLHFRSKDKELALYFRMPTTSQKGNFKERIRGKKVQFLDWHYVVADKPENKELIDKLLHHAQYGNKFQLIPELKQTKNLEETISRYEQMNVLELQAECARRGISRTSDMDKNDMILELIKKETKLDTKS